MGYLPAVQNLFLWSLLAKVVPSAPIGRSIHRALDRRQRAQSATAFSSAPTAACCRCQWMMVGFAKPLWMSTRSMHLLKVPGGPTVRLHHLVAITIVPGHNLRQRRMRTSKYGKKGHAVTSLVLSTTCQSTRARIVKQQKYLMSLCLCIFCLHVWPLSCCDGHGMCMLHHGSCGHFHFGATAVLLQTHRVAYGRDRKRCVACRMGDSMSTSVVTTAVAGWPQSKEKSRFTFAARSQERLRVVRTDRCMYQWHV